MFHFVKLKDEDADIRKYTDFYLVELILKNDGILSFQQIPLKRKGGGKLVFYLFFLQIYCWFNILFYRGYNQFIPKTLNLFLHVWVIVFHPCEIQCSDHQT